MKKKATLILSIIMAAVMTISLAACGSSGGGAATTAAPETTKAETTAAPAETTAAPAETTAAPADDKVYNLVVSSNQPPMANPTRLLKETCDKLTEETNGRLTFDLYDSGNLLAVTDALRGTQDRTADIAIVLGNFCYDYCPINARLLVAPFIGYKSQDQAFEIYKKIREEFPEVDEEFTRAGLVNLGGWFNGRADLYMHGKDLGIKGIDDLRGMKIGVSDAYLMRIFNEIGATASFVTNADMYTSLDNGVVAGIAQHPAILNNTGCGDTIHTVVKFGSSGLNISTGLILMNQDAFNELPDDLKETLKAAFDEYMVAVQATQVEEAEALSKVIDAEIVELSDEDIKPVSDYAKTIIDEIIADLKANGVDGQKIYDRIEELINE